MIDVARWTGSHLNIGRCARFGPHAFAKPSGNRGVKTASTLLFSVPLTLQGMHIVGCHFSSPKVTGGLIIGCTEYPRYISSVMAGNCFLRFRKFVSLKSVYTSSQTFSQSNNIRTIKQPHWGFINMTSPTQSFSYHVCPFSSFQDDVFQLPLHTKNLLGQVKSVAVLFARTWCHTLGR